MERKAVSGIMLILLFMSTLTLAFKVQSAKAEPRTWYVDDSGGKDFTSIASAYYAANPGDTIYVYDGIYNEHLYITKDSLTLVGESRSGTIIDGSEWGYVIQVAGTTGVNISGFTVQNGEHGIYLWQSTGGTLRNISMTGNTNNFGVWGFSLTEYVHDIDTTNTVDGKPVYYWVNQHDRQIPYDAGFVAIVNSSKITMKDLALVNNELGLVLAYSSNSLIENVNVSNSFFHGICLRNSNDNEIRKNTIAATAEYYGIFLWYSNGNTIESNTISNNHDGIWLYYSSGNTVSGNTISSNEREGLYSSYSDNNLICHNNFINNAKNVVSSTSTNVWNDNYPSGGNYWSDYTGVDLYGGPDQDEPSGSDGLGDSPYAIDENNQDNYPLMNPWTPTPPPPPRVHNINTGLNYTWIQEAIDAPETQDGHTIKVDGGIYYERVVVGKSLRLIGENRATTVIDGIGFGAVINVTDQDNIYISGFTIRNGKWGIYLVGSSNNTLRDNAMVDNKYNFLIRGALSHFIHDIDESNTVNGKPIYYWVNRHNEEVPSNAGFVALVNSTNIRVENLNLKSNLEGVLLAYTNSSWIANVNATDNWDGIYLYWSYNNTIIHNALTNNGYAGVYLASSHNNTLVGNTVTANNWYGIWVDRSSNNKITGNEIVDNLDAGIVLSFSSNSTITLNNITHNGYGETWDINAGIAAGDSSGNQVFHNNFINNKQQVLWIISMGIWDNGYPSGGNYWSDYAGVDLYGGAGQNETGSDGVGDTAYTIDANNRDRYPLMKPYTTPPPYDLNEDRVIDIRDIAIAAKAFGSYPDHPRWNIHADINQDNRVDIRDLVVIAKNFGKKYP